MKQNARGKMPILGTKGYYMLWGSPYGFVGILA